MHSGRSPSLDLLFCRLEEFYVSKLVLQESLKKSSLTYLILKIKMKPDKINLLFKALHL